MGIKMKKNNKNKRSDYRYNSIRPTLKKKYLMHRDIFIRFVGLVFIVAAFPVFEDFEDINNPELSHMIVLWKLPLYLLIITCVLIIYLWRKNRSKYYKIVKITEKSEKETNQYIQIQQCFSFSKSLISTDKANWTRYKDFKGNDMENKAKAEFDRLTREKVITEKIIISSKKRVINIGFMEIFKYLYINKIYIPRKTTNFVNGEVFKSKNDGDVGIIIFSIVFVFFYVVHLIINNIFTVNGLYLFATVLVFYNIFMFYKKGFSGELRIIHRNIKQGLNSESSYCLQFYSKNGWAEYKIVKSKSVRVNGGRRVYRYIVTDYDEILEFFNSKTMDSTIEIIEETID
ncbi:hypothetical protein [Marinicellulosiphila megalodicopiae]|uniref:hypothetical protein n=1 Tax=Marinicellulosiphila megalodicopiae TaxID=2724896 RepID=UPI003BB07057